jgi:hypothetical protein
MLIIIIIILSGMFLLLIIYYLSNLLAATQSSLSPSMNQAYNNFHPLPTPWSNSLRPKSASEGTSVQQACALSIRG